MNSDNDHIPDGLIAQLVEYCSSITQVGFESHSSVNFSGFNFFRCDDQYFTRNL